MYIYVFRNCSTNSKRNLPVVLARNSFEARTIVKALYKKMKYKSPQYLVPRIDDRYSILDETAVKVLLDKRNLNLSSTSYHEYADFTDSLYEKSLIKKNFEEPQYSHKNSDFYNWLKRSEEDII